MPADSYPFGVPAPCHDRLVTTSEAAVLLGVDEGALWRLMEEAGVRSHALEEGGQRHLSILVRDLLYLRAYPRLSAGALRLVPGGGEADSEETSREDRLKFQLEVLSGEHARAKERITQLEGHQQRHLDQLEQAQTELEEEREQRQQHELHESRVSEHLAASPGRLDDLELALQEATEDRDRQLEAQNGERAALCAERQQLTEDLAAARVELEELRRVLLLGRAERTKLRRDLELSQEIERATQSYCDRLEWRLDRLG
jgi:hypothetical protein